MVHEDFDLRLKSFKKSADKIKWRHKIPSMVGMARSFYIFAPLSNFKDRVVCTECNAEFTDWRMVKTNPIERHANIHKECFVSKLGTLHTRIASNNPVEISDIKEACLPSFERSGLCELATSLAERGFYYMETKNEGTHHVACVSCLCFPQPIHHPQHSPKCLLAHLLESNKSHEAENQMMNGDLKHKSDSQDCSKSSHNLDGSIQGAPAVDRTTEASRGDASLPRIHDGSAPLQVDSQDDEKSLSQNLQNGSKTCASSRHQYNSRAYARPAVDVAREIHVGAEASMETIFTKFQQCYPQKCRNELINDLECAVMQILELAHAKQVNLIRTEMENIVSTMIHSAEVPL